MSDVEEIKNRINIVDFVGGYVRLEKAGSNWKSKCPFHNDNSPSFMVSEEKQMWHCFGCGKGGDVFTFLMEIESLDFREALKILAEKAGVKLSTSRQDINASGEKAKIFDMLDLATRFYEKQLWDGVGKDAALGYLRERGLSDEVIKKFRLGFSPDGWSNMQNFLIQKGYSTADILKTGLLVDKSQGHKAQFNNSHVSISNLKSNSYDRFRKRIMFPICDVMGKVIGFTSRALPGEDDQAKYINTPETMVYHKSFVLYGIEKAKQAIKEKDFVLLVEGNMDVIASHQAGIENVVAVSGTALTSEQLDILGRYTKNIKMFFDMDEAGQKAALRSSQLAFQKDLNVSVVSSKEGKDAADLVCEDKDLFLKTIERSVGAMQYFFDGVFEKYNKRDVLDKKKIASEIIDIIKNFSNEIEKHHWVRKLAQALETDEKIIIDFLNKAHDSRDNREEIVDSREVIKVALSGTDLLKQKIIGLIISDAALWKSVVEKHKDDLEKYFKKGKVMDVILRKGKEINFDFSKILTDTEDELLRKLYFDNQFKENDDLEEVDRQKLFSEYLGELKRKVAKEELSLLVEEIRKADEKGDKENVLRLTEKLSKFTSSQA
ncbi:MAG: DNA primase [Candidatus Moranbacteria bacterium]|nr:DNA primase [Candidatus Moranbacteria bacterium]